ncbi:kinase-like domain-containing protein [Suillus fuscotomentosus]|uniref:Kinase-like domain-containing protein n=1 Tax=Suillus fuscotomentosus TaxID=1912939 RepID=A0AAD4E7H8_9AGAM|nr:kinase-like domain-containing protein [Suillus fuscotomentosus]KAG1901163.1 kinase-like domain-containing protein [Suillus fuscotomentosus]
MLVRLQQFFNLVSHALRGQSSSVQPSASTPASVDSDVLSRTSDDHISAGRLLTSDTEYSHVISLPQRDSVTWNSGSAFCIKPSDIHRQSSYPTASGGFGDVYRCIWNRGESSDEVAVKSPRFPSLSDSEIAKINKNLDREIRIWAKLKHQYVLPLHGTVEQFGPFRALVSPWMPNGALDSYLHHAHETLLMIDRLRLLEQITEGLQYLHDHDVIHGNLTSDNVLVAADGSPRLADFGISNIMVQSNPTFSYHTGAVRWVAPELLDPPEDQGMQCATRSTDIYALGGIMLQVLYGQRPYWWLKSPIHVLSAKFKRTEPVNASIEIQPNHLDLMRRCWSAKSEFRPSLEEVINHLKEALLNETSSV